MVLRSINPTDGEFIASYEETSPGQAERAIERAAEAFELWRTISFEDRLRPMRRAAELLREGKDRYAHLMAVEMGKPLSQGRSEIEKCASVCEYYADRMESFLSAEEIATEAHKSYISFEPLGVILAVMPWNFPFWQVFRFAAAALMAGNTAVLKHASNVCGCALAIKDVFYLARFPEGVFEAVLVGSRRVEALIEHPAVRAVTLTGSSLAGSAVASSAGRSLKKTVMELGGSDPYIVLEDADLESAAEICAASRLINSGQSCIAAKRFIVPDSVADRFTELLVERMLARKVADPLDEATDVGPLAREDLRDEVHRQVLESVRMGAKLVAGGKLPEGCGFFYPITVLDGVRPGMPAYCEEIFGPVAAIIRVPNEEEAIRIANDTAFGLGAAIFSRDTARAERIAAKKLDAGSCFVNSFVRSDPRLPFGGIKASGYGRELSYFGPREFVNVKTIWIA